MKPTVAILFGGSSAEHDVSLNSATNIFNAINIEKFEPILLAMDREGNWRFNPYYDQSDIQLSNNDYFLNAAFVYLRKGIENVEIIELNSHQVLSKFQVAFPIIHGTFGEDGTLQGILRSLDLPFVGPDLLGSAIGMDKDITKRLLRDANIPIADYFTLYQFDEKEYNFDTISSKLGLPLFVKPANAGSSVGVSKVNNEMEYSQAVNLAFQYDKKILVEEAVIGKEIECAILGNQNVQASVLGEIITDSKFYSYDEKYITLDGIKTKIPAEIDTGIAEKIKETAIKAFRVLSCEGMSRIDFFLRENNTFVLNEINTLPGFTKTSMYPQLWEKTGIPLKILITALINLALERHRSDH